MNKIEVLNKYWGFTEFKPLQEEIITSVLTGNDTLAILPTGGGKSLCYQLSALLVEGTVLVVSPLIALMEDQVKSLEKKGIKAMYFESHSKSLPLSQQLDNCIYGNYKVVYISPERFTNEIFIKQIAHASLSLIAVDEAHCISEWGHDFRPAFRKIAKIRTVFPDLPILALTASATPKVIQDIKDQLLFNNTKLFQQSFERPNLAYKIWNTEDKYNSAAQILKFYSGSSIIYCNTRKKAEQLAHFLYEAGISSDFFHGGLDSEEKKLKLQRWHQGSIINMTATSAFGMGIDKANVRTVIHMELPRSLEQYYQETGRAGRDGNPAKAFLLFNDGAAEQLKNDFLNQLPTDQELINTYKDLCNFFEIGYGEGNEELFILDFDYFCERYNRNKIKTLQILEQFDREGIFSLNAIKEKYIRIESKCSPAQAIDFIKQQNLITQILELLMRQHPYFFNEITMIEPSKICDFLKLSKQLFWEALEQLQQGGFIRYSIPSANFYLIPQTPREDQYTIRPVLNNAKALYQQKKFKIEAMISFALDFDSCKRNIILRYFGSTPEGFCQKCSSITCNKKLDTEPDFEIKLISILKVKPHSIHELKQKLYFEPLALQIILERLLKQKKIKQSETQKYYWINE